MAGGRTRWAVILSGLWMLVFVVALGPVLSAVPIPALAGLLILAGFGSLKPRALARSWQTSKSSGAAALITMTATLLFPIHIAVLIGVILSLLLVGINSASSTHIVALEPARTRPVAPRPRSPPSWHPGRSPSWTSRDPAPSPPSPHCSTSCPRPPPTATAGPSPSSCGCAATCART